MTLERALNTIGKSCFLKYYNEFRDCNDNKKLAKKLFAENDLATSEQAQLARVYCGKWIFENNLEKDALRIIIESKRMDESYKKIAIELLNDRKPNSLLKTIGEFFKSPKAKSKVNNDKVKTEIVMEQISPIANMDFENVKDLLLYYKDKKIGKLVRDIFPMLLNSEKVTDEEISKYQMAEISKEIFGIQYPLLLKVEENEPYKLNPSRYYKNPIMVKGKKYYLCSEWYEGTSNNDRPFVEKWIALKG